MGKKVKKLRNELDKVNYRIKIMEDVIYKLQCDIAELKRLAQITEIKCEVEDEWADTWQYGNWK